MPKENVSWGKRKSYSEKKYLTSKENFSQQNKKKLKNNSL